MLQFMRLMMRRLKFGAHTSQKREFTALATMITSSSRDSGPCGPCSEIFTIKADQLCERRWRKFDLKWSAIWHNTSQSQNQKYEQNTIKENLAQVNFYKANTKFIQPQTSLNLQVKLYKFLNFTLKKTIFV